MAARMPGCRATVAGVVALVIGLVFGAAVAWLYDGKDLHRTETAAEISASTEHAAAEPVSANAQY